MKLSPFTLLLGFALVLLPSSILHARGGGGHAGEKHGGGHEGRQWNHHDNHWNHNHDHWNHNGWWNHHWHNTYHYTYNYNPGYWYPGFGYAWYGGPSVVYQNYTNNSDNQSSSSSGNSSSGSDSVPSVTMGGAWTTFARGHFEDAEEEFGEHVDHHPSSGLPKIGIALSLAEQGQLPRAVIQLRRALHFDPQSLNKVPSSPQVDTQIQDALRRYKGTLSRSSNQADPNFAIACLQYMLGRPNQARAALNLAMKAGDDSIAARNLRNLLGS